MNSLKKNFFEVGVAFGQFSGLSLTERKLEGGDEHN